MTQFYRSWIDNEGVYRFEVRKEIVKRLTKGEGEELGGYTLIAPDPAQPAVKRPIPTPVVQALRAYEGTSNGDYVAVQFNAAPELADSVLNDNCACDALGIEVVKRKVPTIITER